MNIFGKKQSTDKRKKRLVTTMGPYIFFVDCGS